MSGRADYRTSLDPTAEPHRRRAKPASPWSSRLQLSKEDAVLDRLWRERFDEALPMRGASAIVRSILVQHGVDERLVANEIQAARRSKD
jgi:hypothetical protein